MSQIIKLKKATFQSEHNLFGLHSSFELNEMKQANKKHFRFHIFGW